MRLLNGDWRYCGSALRLSGGRADGASFASGDDLLLRLFAARLFDASFAGAGAL